MSKIDDHSPASGKQPAVDEVSFVDLWLTLVRHKWLILATVAVVMSAAFAFTFAREPKYNYITSLEIGTRLVSDSARPIDQPDTVLAKIQESYIPLALHRLRTENPQFPSYGVRARIPKKSEIIVLEAAGRADDGDEIKKLLGVIVEMVREDHKRLYASLRKEIEIKKNQAHNLLASFADEVTRLNAELARTESAGALLKAQIADTERLLRNAEARTASATTSANDESKAFTLLIQENEVRATRQLLGELQQRLHVELANSRDNLIKQVADAKRKQSEQQDVIGKIEVELTNFRETRAIVPPMQSWETVGLRNSSIWIIALFLGSCLGILVAFGAEFSERVRSAGAAGTSRFA